VSFREQGENRTRDPDFFLLKIEILEVVCPVQILELQLLYYGS